MTLPYRLIEMQSVAVTLRMAVQPLQNSASALGAFYRRMRTTLGAPNRLPQPHTSWRESFTTYSKPENPMTKAFSPKPKSNIANSGKTASGRWLGLLATHLRHFKPYKATFQVASSLGARSYPPLSSGCFITMAGARLIGGQ